MSRMKDIYVELTEGIRSIDTRMEIVWDRLDKMLHLMKDMVGLEGKIEKMEADIQVRLSRMEAAQVSSGKLVDRLIEMSMVVKGQADQAVLHRSQTARDTGFDQWQTGQSVEEQEAEYGSEEEVWPPKGCDAMDITN